MGKRGQAQLPGDNSATTISCPGLGGKIKVRGLTRERKRGQGRWSANTSSRAPIASVRSKLSAEPIPERRQPFGIPWGPTRSTQMPLAGCGAGGAVTSGMGVTRPLHRQGEAAARTINGDHAEESLGELAGQGERWRVGNHLTTAPGQGAGSRGKLGPTPLAWGRDSDLGRSSRPATLPPPLRLGDPSLPRRWLENPAKEGTHTHLPGAPHRSRRRALLGPLVAPSSAAALAAALKGLKGRAAPPPEAPGRAAPPAGTWSPRSPGPSARTPPRTTTPEPPRQRHRGDVGGAWTSGNRGLGTSDTEIERRLLLQFVH